jgi:PhnB protein
VPRGFSLTLNIPSAVDAERIFAALSADGSVAMPLEKTFWAERYGHVVDRFGIKWVINCEGVDAGV